MKILKGESKINLHFLNKIQISDIQKVGYTLASQLQNDTDSGYVETKYKYR